MKTMTWRIILGSLRHRKGRFALSVCAIGLSTSLVVAALNVRHGMRGRLAQELRSYGANLLLVPAAGQGLFLKENGLAALGEKEVKERLLGYAPFLYKLLKVEGKEVVFAGTVFASVRNINPWWQVEGRWPQGKEEALVGANAASKLGLRVGGRFAATAKGAKATLTVAGILRTGGAEEHQIFVRLADLQLLADHPGLLSSVLVSHRSDYKMAQSVALLQRAWPDAEARTVLQVVRAEEALLSRLETFLLLVSLLVLFVSALSVFAGMTTAAMERKVEMALMRALGARQGEVAWIFASEAGAMGIAGGLFGSLFGLLFAQAIGLSVFRSLVSPSVASPFVGIMVGLAISSSASLFVIRRAAALAPAVVLKKE